MLSLSFFKAWDNATGNQSLQKVFVLKNGKIIKLLVFYMFQESYVLPSVDSEKVAGCAQTIQISAGKHVEHIRGQLNSNGTAPSLLSLANQCFRNMNISSFFPSNRSFSRAVLRCVSASKNLLRRCQECTFTTVTIIIIIV